MCITAMFTAVLWNYACFMGIHAFETMEHTRNINGLLVDYLFIYCKTGLKQEWVNAMQERSPK